MLLMICVALRDMCMYTYKYVRVCWFRIAPIFVMLSFNVCVYVFRKLLMICVAHRDICMYTYKYVCVCV